MVWVQIHHSKDLVHWELIGQVLTNTTQLNLRGVLIRVGFGRPVCPTIMVFYLVYTNVKSFDGVWKDTPNFLVTTTNIRGEWSAPVFLHARGFDGSLFHQSNGKNGLSICWLITAEGNFFEG